MSQSIIINFDNFTNFLSSDKVDLQIESNDSLQVSQDLINNEVIA